MSGILRKSPWRLLREFRAFTAGKTPWGVPCDVALPCATQNELLGDDAKTLVKNGEFPQPRKTSDRRVAWLLREIEEWAESRPIADLPPPNIVAKKTRQAGGKIPSQ